jgi:hypothetical protein
LKYGNKNIIFVSSCLLGFPLLAAAQPYCVGLSSEVLPFVCSSTFPKKEVMLTNVAFVFDRSIVQQRWEMSQTTNQNKI